MADEVLKRDVNRSIVTGAVTSSASQEIRNARMNDTTKGILVDVAGGTNISSAPARTTLTPALTAQTLIAANANRRGLRIVHTSVDPSQNCWFSPATASSTSFFTKKQDSYEIELYDAVTNPYTGAWTFISDVASGTTQIFELS